MMSINIKHIEGLAELIVNRTPGTIMYIGTNMEQAAQAKALLDVMLRGNLLPYIPRFSSKRKYVTETQHFLFTSARSVMAGYTRGLTFDRVYIDVDGVTRSSLLPILLPSMCSYGGQLF